MNQNRPLLAAAWMTGSIFAFTAMAVAGRYVMVELDTFEVMTYRSLLGIAMVVLVAAASGTLRQVNTQNFGLHILRNIFHFTGQNLWFFAVSLIPLAQLVALEFTTPLWVILFAPFLLAERIGLARGISVLVGFAGILIVARPDFRGAECGADCRGRLRRRLCRRVHFHQNSDPNRIDHLHSFLPCHHPGGDGHRDGGL